ncbi:hypothetical protein CEXT_623741 [Caerostris extrusa]|uniref:Uncharacterized protein n=1 Tax=Caerostris extrusa TaxID=172846 RepID=A0AAV4Y0T4_CAEEX|nr:hypothetical protein CEXT_623741 [Caerostris extrusa]
MTIIDDSASIGSDGSIVDEAFVGLDDSTLYGSIPIVTDVRTLEGNIPSGIDGSTLDGSIPVVTDVYFLTRW